MDALSWLITILVCHQIVTIWTYISLRREDKGIDTTSKTKFSEFLQLLFLGFPMIVNCLYDSTLGLVDYFRQKRLCNMLADCNDEISRLKKEISRLNERQKDLISENARLRTISETTRQKSSVTHYQVETEDGHILGISGDLFDEAFPRSPQPPDPEQRDRVVKKLMERLWDSDDT